MNGKQFAGINLYSPPLREMVETLEMETTCIILIGFKMTMKFLGIKILHSDTWDTSILDINEYT